jgi:hypothetical protein
MSAESRTDLQILLGLLSQLTIKKLRFQERIKFVWVEQSPHPLPQHRPVNRFWEKITGSRLKSAIGYMRSSNPVIIRVKVRSASAWVCKRSTITQI